MGPFYKRGEKYLHVFDVEACANCGGEVVAPNMVNVILADESRLKRLGLKAVERIPPVQFYADSNGPPRSVCEACEGLFDRFVEQTVADIAKG